MRLRYGLLLSLALGMIFQYWMYGDASLVMVSTWMHVLFWYWFVLVAIIGYLFLAGIILFLLAALYVVVRHGGALWDIIVESRQRRRELGK